MATKGRSRADIGSAYTYFPITPSDGSDLAVEISGLIVAVGGNVVLDRLDGQTVTLTLPAGYFPLQAQRVRATDTTATGLTGLV